MQLLLTLLSAAPWLAFRCEVKVIDLGSSCFTSDQLSSYVQSRSYRAPEVILGLPYDQKVMPSSLLPLSAIASCNHL